MKKNKNIIVLGGAGYIGSHTAQALHLSGYTPIIVDNLSRGHRLLCGDFTLEQADILDTNALITIFESYTPLAIMHFAAFTDVAESVSNPDIYHNNNVKGTASVLKAMAVANIPYIIFSSTAAVYGQPKNSNPLLETDDLLPINPYGETKKKAETLIQNSPDIKSICLRYFNAAGAHDSNNIGESHFPETHLIPLIIQAALKLRSDISIFGNNYNTKDGTCVRDYIHVMDLADAHMKALEYLLISQENNIFNLGNGSGYSVQEVINMVSHVTNKSIGVKNAKPRKGDPATLIANATKANEILEWVPKITLQNIVKSAYQWHQSDTYQALLKNAQRYS